MKFKTFVVATLLIFVGTFASMAQGSVKPPVDCSNDGLLNGIIQSEQAQGWKVSSMNFYPIYYLAPPTTPYLSGTLNVSFVPDCQPGEACIKIIKIAQLDVMVINDNGTCLYKK